MVLCLILLVCCAGCHRAQFWDQQNLSDLSVSVGNMQVSPSSKVRDLGVVFDQ